jgi:hypothetical protein
MSENVGKMSEKSDVNYYLCSTILKQYIHYGNKDSIFIES